ncbi:hypothetical protein ACF0H5_021301 [Mactra antiquata]
MASSLKILVIVAWLQCVLGAPGKSSQGLRCHQCTGVTDPHYCSMVVHCDPGEECHTEKVIGEDSTVFYNSGCQDVQLCQLAANGKRSELHVCEGCCGTDLCNSELCPVNNNTTPGVQCYQCDEVDDPKDCQNRITCADSEQCIVQKYVNDNMDIKYSLGCETVQRCHLLETLSRRSTQMCNECCDTPGCNRHKCQNGSTIVDNTCADEPDIDCKLADDSHNICEHRTLAATKYCRKYCGYCSTDGGSTLPPPTGTTVEVCVDSGDIDCKQMNDSLQLCSHTNSPPVILYCPKFCGICTPSSVTTVPSVTPDPCRDDGSIDCKQMNETLGICAKRDPATVQYCSKFCGICKPACADSPDVDCKLANDTHNACALGTRTAVNFCPKFCGYCTTDGSPTKPQPTGTASTCVDSGDIDCKQMDDNLHICQQKTSPPTIMYCSKYCGLC